MVAVDYRTQDMLSRSLQAAFNGAATANGMIAQQFAWMGLSDIARSYSAMGEMFRRGAKIYEKPSFGLDFTQIGDDKVAVHIENLREKPFGSLLHFSRETDRQDPKILLVAPMSGHYATLLRGTVEGLLPNHDVYITDWANARDVPLAHGEFGLDDYSLYVEEFLNRLGPDVHVVAVCQPTVPVLATAAIMAARNAPNQPLSLTLMGGPIDTAAAPTDVTKLAGKRSLDWFKNTLLSPVPAGYAGQGRLVYPGYVQGSAFISMNLDRHIQSHVDMFNHLNRGNADSAARISEFYDEYLALTDLDARFYIETVDQVFQRRLLPKGEMVLQNQKVDLSTLKRTPLLTVEGALDDISAPGQTESAHRLIGGSESRMKCHHLQEGSGHYGIFSGRKYRQDIAPRIAHFVRQAGEDKGLKYSEIPHNTRLMPPNLWQKSATRQSPLPALQK